MDFALAVCRPARAKPVQGRRTVLSTAMPCAVDQSVITIDSSTAVASDTVNHEGILEDRGRNPNELLAAHGEPKRRSSLGTADGPR
jgi:hypothetical protein